MIGSNPEKNESAEPDSPKLNTGDLLNLNNKTNYFGHFSNHDYSPESPKEFDEARTEVTTLCNSKDLGEQLEMKCTCIERVDKEVVPERVRVALTSSLEDVRCEYLRTVMSDEGEENEGNVGETEKRCSSAVELRNWSPFAEEKVCINVDRADALSTDVSLNDGSCRSTQNLDDIQNGVLPNTVNIIRVKNEVVDESLEESFGTKCNDNNSVKVEKYENSCNEKSKQNSSSSSVVKNNSHYTNNQRNLDENEMKNKEETEEKSKLDIKMNHHDDRSDKHKTSSSHRSRDDKRSSSDYRCSHCKRRKTKYTNQGVQCRRDHDLSNRHLRRLSPSTKLLASGNMSSHPSNRKLKYRKYMHIEEHSNGGALILHMYQKEISHLSKEQMKDLASEFFQVAFAEDENNHAEFVMAIVHGAATYLPDLLEYMTLHHPQLTVKNGVLGRSSDIETCSISQYHEQVHKHYQNGTVRYGPLHQVSLAGVAHEEVGGYFPDLLDKLEENPFLDMVMPWGALSVVHMNRMQSNDGPILWIRPGEQLVPTAEFGKNANKRKR